MTTFARITGKRRPVSLVLDDTVPVGFMRVVKGKGGDQLVYASAASWAANGAGNLASAWRPAGVP